MQLVKLMQEFIRNYHSDEQTSIMYKFYTPESLTKCYKAQTQGCLPQDVYMVLASNKLVGLEYVL